MRDVSILKCQVEPRVLRVSRDMRRLGSWLVALVLVLRAIALAAPVIASFVLVTALMAGTVEDARGRVAIGVAACLGLPLLLRWRLPPPPPSRKKKLHPPSWVNFVAVSNFVVAGAVAFGFADDS